MTRRKTLPYIQCMTLSDLTDRDAVLRALEEFDAVGREVFLATYGFARATGYVLEHEGRAYDSKAIAGVAHKHQTGTVLTPSAFSGGATGAVKVLRSLGFTVSGPSSPPPWTTDELMIVLHTYLDARGTVSFRRTLPLVRDLSALLRSLDFFPEDVRTGTRFRNVSGVALKLHNFEAIDPDYPGTGMPHGSAADRRVWDEWSGRKTDLAIVVRLILEGARRLDIAPEDVDDEAFEAAEGRVVYRLRRSYERDRALVTRKKHAVLRIHGRLACEVCGFDSQSHFGIAGVIDVHHIAPLHKVGESVTSLEDLVVVCPTCHRLLHTFSPVVTPAELREIRSCKSALG